MPERALLRRTLLHYTLMTVLATPAFAQGSDPRTEVMALDRSTSESAWAKGLVPALAGVLHDSAIVLWPGAPVLRGKAEVARFFAAQPAGLGAARFMWQPLHVDSPLKGDVALIWGSMVVDRPAVASTPATHRIGKYLAVWRRAGGAGWRLAVFAPVGVLPGSETVWNDSIGSHELPDLLKGRVTTSPHPAVAFAIADSSFAADAAHNRAAAAFGKWASPDAFTFAGSGELNIGPAKIRAAIKAIGDAEWRWAPVEAFMSAGVGYTVGQATTTTHDSAGRAEVSKSKYVTFWRKMPGGKVRFVADGGNGRP